MKWILYLIMFFSAMGGSKAETLKLQVENKVEVKGQVSLPLPIKKAGYYRGYVRSDHLLSEVLIINAQGKIIKKVIGSPTQENEIFWLLDKPGEYHLLISSVAQQAVEVEVLLRPIALKKQQYLSPNSALSSPRLKQLAKQIKQGDKQAEQLFWKQLAIRGAPMVEYTDKQALLTFLYKGPVNNVRLLGAPYGGHTQLTQLEGTQVWFHTFIVPSTTRLSYRLAANVPQLKNANYREQRRAVLATAQPDPLNQGGIFSKQDNLFGAASMVILKDAPEYAWLANTGNPTGDIADYWFKEKSQELRRKITIYRPNKKYKMAKDAPVLILFDGDAYLQKIPTTTIVDNLIASGKIPPMKVVFFNQPRPSMRSEELTPNQDFANFLANEFKDWLCVEQQICSSAKNTLLAGSSFGGLAAAYIAFKHPDKFAKVLSLSGSFWWSPMFSFVDKSKSNWLTEEIIEKPKVDVQVYLSVGLFETEPKGNSLLASNRQMYQALHAQGYQVTLIETASGHDYFNWQLMLGKGLINLFNNHK